MNCDYISVIGLIIGIIAIPLSVWGSWYYNRIRKIKLIYNNFIYYMKENQLDLNSTQEMYLNKLIDEFGMKLESGNEYIENIRHYRNLFYIKRKLIENEKEMMVLFKQNHYCFNKIRNIQNEYNSYINKKITKSELCKPFYCSIKWNDKPNYETNDNEIIKNIETICNDNHLFDLMMNLTSRDKIVTFINYYDKNEYKDNVLFKKETIMNDSMKTLIDEIKNLNKKYDGFLKQKLELEEKIKTYEYIGFFDLIEYDINNLIN